jgi:hypothetical protein
VNRLALLFGIAAMELCWVYPWSVLGGAWATPEHPRALLSPASVLGLLLIGGLATQGILRAFGPRRIGQVVLVALGVLCIALAVRVDQFPASSGIDWIDQLVRDIARLLGSPTAPALATALGMFLWWRAVSIGSSGLSFLDAENTFRWGIGALVLAGGLLAITTPASVRPALEAEVAPFVVGFFFVGLLTLALGRLESLRSKTRGLALNTQWLGVLIAVAGLLVLAALVVAQVLSFDLLVAATRPIFNAIGFILLLLILVLVIPIAYAVELLVYLIQQLIRRDPDQPPPEPLEPSEIQEMLRRLFGQLLAPEVLDTLRAIGVVVLLVVALLLVARTVARWRPGSTLGDAVEEERDTLWDANRARAMLLAWLRGLFHRRRTRVATSPHPDPLPEGEGSAPERSVREVYRRLLRLGTAAGAAREPSVTPFEHLPSLTRALEPENDLEHLTDAYVLARYAESEPADVTDLERRLDRIQHRLAQDSETNAD